MNNHHENTTISISIVDTESQPFNATESCIDSNSPYLTEYGLFDNSFPSLPNIDTSVSPYSMNQAMQSPGYEFSVSDGLSALSLQTESQPTSPQSPYHLELSSSQSDYESSDSGSLHSPDPIASPMSPWYTSDLLAVPFAGRGRSLHRSVSCRHSPYGSPRVKTRSPSNASAHSEDMRMTMPVPHHYRSRSLSDASSSSPNGAFSDGSLLLFSPHSTSSQSFSSREHSPASSLYSLDVPEASSPDNDGRFGKSKKYRTKVGSKAIQDASASRRKKEAKFFCEEAGCSSSFTTQQNLLHHINSHKGEKPYPCKNAPECPKRFGTPHVANRHSHSCPKSKKMTSPHANLVPPNTFYRHHV
ncbi:hypothetical protein VNI00_013609 [Paramarasmius palmivorus]|uniref:C2H2-type domain-containing protein n=1 Tax=Paramarasmius palmivorus TaxID=297713 RepID=A0AAW0BW61_9AGAR